MITTLVTRTEGVNKYKDLLAEEIVAAIARHGIIKEDNGKLVKHLMDNKHWSPLDMINFGFEIETSRSIGRQLLRHWSIKPQEHSQRYSNAVAFEAIELRMEHPTNRQSSTDAFDPTIKNVFSNAEKASKVIEDLLTIIEVTYFKLLEAGVAKECARDILPGCTRTTLTMNGSLRSWLAFLNVRMDEHTQKEARAIAACIGEALEIEMPNLFATIDWRKGMFM
jgi:thymidylate synthase (FAD)